LKHDPHPALARRDTLEVFVKWISIVGAAVGLLACVVFIISGNYDAAAWAGISAIWALANAENQKRLELCE